MTTYSRYLRANSPGIGSLNSAKYDIRSIKNIKAL